MTDQEQRAMARAFRDRHHRSEILALPCAWDAASARLFAEVGFPAVGTSSGAIAHSLGYPDGQAMPVETMLAAIERIVDAVSVPVSADFEAGYGTDVETVRANVDALLDAGVVGLNIEDGTGPDADLLVDRSTQVALIEAIRSLADARDLPLVINARTDAFLHGEGEPADRYAEAVERANAYRAAGADCLFPIGVTEPAVVEDLVADVDGPINVLAFGPDGPSPAELERLGVARVSTGAGPMHMALAYVRQFGEQLRERGEFAGITGNRVSRWDLEEWFAEPSN